MDYDLAIPSREFHPRVKENLCVIVVGLVIRDEKVLLIQEAKSSCRGHYFLPAGRLEVNETLLDGVRREVLEESGLVFEPRRCVLVEINGPFWISITFLGVVTGGSLKTTPDAESLGAGWFSIDTIQEAEKVWMQNRHHHSSTTGTTTINSNFVLRAAVLHMIEAGLRYLAAPPSAPDLLPSTQMNSVRCILYQLAIVSFGKTNNPPTLSGTHLLLSGSRLPAFRLNSGHPLETIDKFMQVLFSSGETADSNLAHYWDTKHISVLGVAVTPRLAKDGADGLVVTLRIIFTTNPTHLPPNPGYHWHALDSLNKSLQPLVQLLSLPPDTNLLPPYLYHTVHRMDPTVVRHGASKL